MAASAMVRADSLLLGGPTGSPAFCTSDVHCVQMMMYSKPYWDQSNRALCLVVCQMHVLQSNIHTPRATGNSGEVIVDACNALHM